MHETRDELVASTVEVVCGLEPHLKASSVRGAVESSLPSLVTLRSVARAVHRNPTVLTGTGERCIADIEPLIHSVVQIGGTAVRFPLCADCGRNPSETYSRKLKRRICRSCAMARWQPDAGPCANCGKVRRQVYRARNGGWLCWTCRPESDVDHAAEVRAGIHELGTGLSDVEIAAVASVFRTTRALRELDWILHDTPEVFTGLEPHRSAVSVRLAELLIAAGAAGIRPLQCPLCFRDVRPSCALDGMRCCHRCWSHRRSRGLCARCGQERHLTRACLPTFGVLASEYWPVTRMGVISDEFWAVVEPLMPSDVGKCGRRFGDHRLILEGIAWRFRTGSPWRDLPTEFGPWQTVWKRHHRWSLDGTYDEMFARIAVAFGIDAEMVEDIEKLLAVDSTSVRAHQHSAGARSDTLHTGGTVELQESCRGA